MDKNIKQLIVGVTTFALLLVIVSCYFMWTTYDANNTLDVVRNNLDTTLNKLNIAETKLVSVQESLEEEMYKSTTLDKTLDATNKELENISLDLEIANATINDLKEEEYKLVYLGEYSITHYCTERYEHICGTGNGITATGTVVTAGRTVAVDPSVIPYGTTMYIEGYGWRVAEDCGGGVNGRHIDMAVDTHADAWYMGSAYKGVWILVKNT